MPFAKSHPLLLLFYRPALYGSESFLLLLFFTQKSRRLPHPAAPILREPLRAPIPCIIKPCAKFPLLLFPSANVPGGFPPPCGISVK